MTCASITCMQSYKFRHFVDPERSHWQNSSNHPPSHAASHSMIQLPNFMHQSLSCAEELSEQNTVQHIHNRQTYCDRYLSDLVFGRVVDGPMITLLGNLPEKSGSSFRIVRNSLKSIASRVALTFLWTACSKAFGSTNIYRHILNKNMQPKDFIYDVFRLEILLSYLKLPAKNTCWKIAVYRTCLTS